MWSKRGTQRNVAGDSNTSSSRDRGALSGTLAGVSFVSGVAGAVALADSPYPRPGSEAADIRRYFSGNAGAARISVVGQLIGAASLARFTVSVASLAARSGRRSRGLQAAALAGGGLAVASLAASALCALALSGSRGERESSAVALHRLMFAAGGPVHGTGFGVLVGSLGVAGLRTGELPRPLAVADFGGRWLAVATVLRMGARSVVHPGRTVLGVVGRRHRRGPPRAPPGLTLA